MDILTNPEDPFPIRPELIQNIRSLADGHARPVEAHRAIDWSLATLARVAPDDPEMHELYLGALARKFTEG